MSVAGSARGIFDHQACVADGHAAGIEAANAIGLQSHDQDAEKGGAEGRIEADLGLPVLRATILKKERYAFVDLQNARKSGSSESINRAIKTYSETIKMMNSA